MRLGVSVLVWLKDQMREARSLGWDVNNDESRYPIQS